MTNKEFNDWFNNPTDTMKSAAQKAMARFATAMGDLEVCGRSYIEDVSLFGKSRRYYHSLLERVEKKFGFFNAFQVALRDLSFFEVGRVPKEFQIKNMTESAMYDNYLGQCCGAYRWLEEHDIRPSFEG